MIGNVNFGKLDAESDANLRDFFVDTGHLARLASGEKHFILGRKGSGKTALFRLAEGQNLGNVTVIGVEFDKYPWAFHSQLKQTGVLAESAFEASWRFLFHLTMVREWAEYAASPLKQKAKRLLDKIVPDPYRGFFASILARIKNAKRVSLPGMSVAKSTTLTLGSIDLGDSDAGAVLSAITVHADALAALVAENYLSDPIVIKIDRLDDAWDGSAEAKNLLVGELKAARTLNNELAQKGSPAAVLTFLRTDIFDTLRFNDKNKLSSSAERLDWTNEKLIQVVTRRIAFSLNSSESDVWKLAFTTEPMRQGVTPPSYLTKRTMGRPRDIIAFALECQAVARAHKHDVATKDDIYEAESAYSQFLLDELVDELHKQRPEVEQYFDCLREVGVTVFKIEDWIAASERRTQAVSEGVAKDQLTVLFQCSAIGFPKVGGKEGGSGFSFAHTDRNAKPDFARTIRVHWGLKKALDVRDPYKKKGDTSSVEGSTDDDDDDDDDGN